MRWVGLAVVILSFPLFVALLGQQARERRDVAVLSIGALLFCVGSLSPSAAVYIWPAWQGLSKGIFISLLDTLALALVVTRRPVRSVAFWPLMALYLLTIVSSLTLADNRMAGTFIIFQFLQVGLLFLALAGELRRPSAVRMLLRGLAVGLIIQTGYVMRQKLAGMVQAPGTFEHQNVLGLAVELSVLPLIAAVMEGERSKLVYAGIVGGAICVAGSGSRGTMGFFAIGAILVVVSSVMRRGTRRKWQMIALGAIAAMASSALAVATLSERFGGKPFETEETARTVLAEAARGMAADNPVTGVGANSFVVANNIGGYIDRTGVVLTQATRSQPAHNAYLVARAERGYPGQAALLLLLGGMATLAVMTAFRHRRSAYAGISLGAAGAIVAVGLHSNYEYALLTSGIMSLLFTVGALISGLRDLAARESSRSAVRSTSRDEVAARQKGRDTTRAAGRSIPPGNEPNRRTRP